MRTALSDFFGRWPWLAIIGTFLFAAAVGFAVAAGVAVLVGSDERIYLGFMLVFLWVAALSWGIVLSNVGADATSGRSFPLCFPLWLFRPPQRGDVAALDNAEPHDLRMGVFYLVAIVPIALLRALQYSRDRTPRRDDLYSLKRVWPHEGWMAVEVVRSGAMRVSIRVIRSSTQRLRTLRFNPSAPRSEAIDLDLEEFRGLQPKLLWRGEREFWTRDTPEESGKSYAPPFFRTRSYDAIRTGGRNVARLEEDPHAFDNSKLRE